MEVPGAQVNRKLTRKYHNVDGRNERPALGRMLGQPLKESRQDEISISITYGAAMTRTCAS